MENTILIVEDEKNISDIIKFNLEKEGYSIKQAFDGKKGLEMALEIEPELLLLDVMLPEMDGFEICKKVRTKSNVPIIMLTAKDEEVDKVLGLELGADDYITKPFSMRELIARVKANMRRKSMNISDSEESDADIVKAIDITIDNRKFEVRKSGDLIDLTVREFELLKYLAKTPGEVCTREELLTEVWGYEYIGDVRTVDVTVRRLREKIEDDPSNPDYIITKRGVGYFFKDEN